VSQCHFIRRRQPRKRASGVRNVGQGGVVPAHVSGLDHIVVLFNGDNVSIPLLRKPRAQPIRRKPYDERVLGALHCLFHETIRLPTVTDLKSIGMSVYIIV